MHKQAIRFLGLLAFCARVQHSIPASYYRYGTAAYAGPGQAKGGAALGKKVRRSDSTHWTVSFVIALEMENPTLLYEGGRQDEAQERSIDKTGTPPFTKSGNSGEAFSQGQAKSQWW